MVLGFVTFITETSGQLPLFFDALHSSGTLKTVSNFSFGQGSISLGVIYL